LLAQGLKLGGQTGHQPLAGLLPGLQLPCPGVQAGAFLQAFLFLRGQALDLIDNSLNLLLQQPLGILQGALFSFVRGDGNFLGAEFGLRLLETGLQFRLFALESAFAPADFSHSALQQRQRCAQLHDLVLASQD
jgi:hypothetical protein